MTEKGWIPEFFGRTYGWERGAVGMWYGTIVMTMGSAGIVFGGRLADKLSKAGRRDGRMYVGFIAAVVWIVTGVVYPLVPNGTLAMILLAPTVFFAAMPFGVAPAAIQEMMPNAMRAQASAIYLFVVNLIGLGIGPTAVAVVTQKVLGGDEMLRYSLLYVTVGAHTLAAILLWLGRKPYVKSLDYLKDWTEAQA